MYEATIMQSRHSMFSDCGKRTTRDEGPIFIKYFAPPVYTLYYNFVAFNVSLEPNSNENNYFIHIRWKLILQQCLG